MEKHHSKDNIYYRIPYLSTEELLGLQLLWRLLSESTADNPRSPNHHKYYALMAELEKRENAARKVASENTETL